MYPMSKGVKFPRTELRVFSLLLTFSALIKTVEVDYTAVKSFIFLHYLSMASKTSRRRALLGKEVGFHRTRCDVSGATCRLGAC